MDNTYLETATAIESIFESCATKMHETKSIPWWLIISALLNVAKRCVIRQVDD